MEISPGINGIKSLGIEIFQSSSIVLESPPGKVRNYTRLNFISKNLKSGGSALIVLSRNSPEDILESLRRKGVDVKNCIEQNRIFIVDWFSHKRERIIGIDEQKCILRSSSDILNVSISINRALRKLSMDKPRIAFLDIIDESINTFGWKNTQEYIKNIMSRLKKRKFATLYTIDEPISEERLSKLYSDLDLIFKFRREMDNIKLKIKSYDSRYSDKDNIDILLEEDSIKVQVKEKITEKQKGTHISPLKGISDRIFGKSNAKKSKKQSQQGLTNSKVNGRTNGLTNGKVNGRTNGLTNGKVNGRTNGLTNGEVNGRTNGLTNGDDTQGINESIMNSFESTTDTDKKIVNKSLSSNDGLINGIVGIGGDKEFHSDYIKGDDKTSLPSDDGLINGLSGTIISAEENIVKDTFDLQKFSYGPGMIPSRGMPKSWFRKGLGTVLIMIFLLLIPVMLNVLYVPMERGVEIDGNFDDWNGIKAYYDLSEKKLDDASIDIKEYKLKVDNGYLYIYIRVDGKLFDPIKGVDSIRCFINLKNNNGYNIADIKADYLLEIYGWDSKIQGSTYYKFNQSHSANDWNGFYSTGSSQVAKNESSIESRIWIGDNTYKNPSMVVHTQHETNFDISKGKVWDGKDALIAHITDFGPSLVDRGEITPFFKIKIHSITKRAFLKNLTIEYNKYSNEIVDGIYLYKMDNYTDSLSTIQPLIEKRNFTGKEDFCINEEVSQKPKEYIVAGSVKKTAKSESVVGLKLTKVACKDGIGTVKKVPLENKYIDSLPSNPEVDGSFIDWSSVPMQSDDYDDLSPTGEWNPNIDINSISMNQNGNISFFVRVAGNMMGGADVPYIRNRPPEIKDKDRDSIPDIEDPYPEDFNNDGIPDIESYHEGFPDVDKDGIPDYPDGSDKWLNTTIDPELNVPSEYKNKNVSRYIGPVSVPVKTGEDYIRIFIDSDANKNTGYTNTWLNLGAEYMLEITGRDRRITSANYSEYKGDRRDWGWDTLGKMKVALNRTCIETGLNLSNLDLNNGFKISYAMSDWRNNLDRTKPILESNFRGVKRIGLKSDSNSYNFYLRNSDQLLSQEGDNEMFVNLRNNGVTNIHSWNSTTFAGDYNITSKIDIPLYLNPYPVGRHDPGLNITLSFNNTIIGYTEIQEISGEGWYSFYIDPLINEIPAGASLNLETKIIGGPDSLEIDIYYNSQSRPSRVCIPSNKIINIKSINFYNSSGELDDIFEGGESVEVQSKVTHPFTANDISEARISVYYPNGSLMISNQPMNLYDQDDSAIPFWNNFNYSFNLNENAVGGNYEVVVSATDIQGNIDTRSSIFTVPKNPGVSVYPDDTKTSDPGTRVTFNVYIKNIGNMNDIYELEISSSTMDWSTNLTYGDNLVASDYDGDGNWDYINSSWDSNDNGYPDVALSSMEEELFSLEKNIPTNTQGEIDTTRLYANSYYYNIYDFAEFETKTPVPQAMKTLYLKNNDEMDTFNGSSTTQINIPGGSSHTWIQNPPMAGDFTFRNYSSIFLYIEPEVRGHRVPDVTTVFRDGNNVIGSDTIHDIDTNGWYEFLIDTSDYSLSAGNPVYLDISSGDNPINVYYGSGVYNSRLEIHTDTYVEVEDIRVYNESGLSDEVSAGDNLDIQTKISDPLGSYDISGAKISVYDPNGNVLINNHSMNYMTSDSTTPSFWNEYNFSYSLPENSITGSYQIEITGIESNGVKSTSYGLFFIPSGVDIYPDNNSTEIAGSYVEYNHTIKNNGKGANIYNINLGSSQGWNISLYSDSGTLIGTDLHGDGSWDFLNTDFDSNNDGIPDSGLLLPGEEIDIEIEIEIPAEISNGTIDTTTVSVTSIYDQDTTDSATDITEISEFTDIFLPVISTIGLFFGMFVYRRIIEKENKDEEHYNNNTGYIKIDSNGSNKENKEKEDDNVE